jgi:hypothetical protein
MVSGTIRLRSGEWAWRVFQAHDAETLEVVWSSCQLHLLDAQESRMQVRLGPGETMVDEEFLLRAASHPSDRDIVDASALGWTFIELNRPMVTMGVGPDPQEGPSKVLFFCQDGRCGVDELPSRCGLGEATDEELLELIQRAT